MPVTSHADDLDWVVVPIAKFSHNSCPVGTRNFVWTHVSLREDMDVVFQNSRIVDNFGNIAIRVVMKVTAGAELLEIQDLGDLVRICSGVVDTFSGSEQPVQVVTKSPFIAMRYPQANANIVRRIQVKFKNDADFTKVRKILEELRLPVTTSTTTTSAVSIVQKARLPSISPAMTMFSSASLGTSSSSTIAPSPLPAVFADPEIRSSPDKSLFRVPMQPDSVVLSASRPASNPSYLNDQLYHRSSSAFASLSTVDPFTASHTACGDNIFAKNQISSLYLSQTEKESSGRQFSYPLQPSLSQGNFTGICPTYTAATPQRRSYIASDLRVESSTAHHPTESPFFTSRNPVQMLTESPQPSKQDLKVGDSFDIQSIDRYGLKEKTYDMIVNGNMPPKRSLPFPVRPSSTSSLPINSSNPSVPVSSSINEDTLANVTPKPTQCTIPKVSNKRVTQAKAPAIKAKKMALTKSESVKDVSENVLENDEVAVVGVKASPVAAKHTTASRPAPTVQGLPGKASATKKRAPPRPSSAIKRPKMVDVGTQTQMESACEHSTASKYCPRVLALNYGPCERQPPTSPPENYLDTLDVVVAKYKDRPAPITPEKELWETPGYAEMNQDERHILLNDFICKNLDNPHFLQLLKDTDKSWRRVALGI